MATIRIWGKSSIMDLDAKDVNFLKRYVPNENIAYRASKDILELYIPVTDVSFKTFMLYLIDMNDMSVDEFIELLKDQ